MDIYVVQSGDTLTSIAEKFGVRAALIAGQNGLVPPYPLAVGQSLGIFYPAAEAVVKPGDTLFSVAEENQVSVGQLYRCNPQLLGSSSLTPGQILTISLTASPTRSMELLGYAYPVFQTNVLRQILPYAAYLSPFTYGIGENSVVKPDAEALLLLAKQYSVTALLHLSSLGEDGRFSSQAAAELLRASARWEPLSRELLAIMEASGYGGLDVDFEYVGGENRENYVKFLAFLREKVNAAGKILFTALAPKTSDTQPGVLYEGHDYALLGQNADRVLVMTYEWGYTYGPAMAVAPLPSVKRVMDYAVSRIAPDKIFMGFPNYGYDWTLPYVAGTSRATSISNVYAPLLAAARGAEIRYDQTSCAPWFTYTDDEGLAHEVWFEDIRSAQAKYELAASYGVSGLGFWNFMRPFPVGFLLAESLFHLASPL